MLNPWQIVQDFPKEGKTTLTKIRNSFQNFNCNGPLTSHHHLQNTYGIAFQFRYLDTPPSYACSSHRERKVTITFLKRHLFQTFVALVLPLRVWNQFLYMFVIWFKTFSPMLGVDVYSLDSLLDHARIHDESSLPRYVFSHSAITIPWKVLRSFFFGNTARFGTL